MMILVKEIQNMQNNLIINLIHNNKALIIMNKNQLIIYSNQIIFQIRMQILKLSRNNKTLKYLINQALMKIKNLYLMYQIIQHYFLIKNNLRHHKRRLICMK